MKTWEIDVELRVRKTLRFKAPGEDAARWMAEAILASGVGAENSAFFKWTDGRNAYRPTPVETIIDNGPKIVAVREVPSSDPEPA